jgi:hypothetical protein
MTTMSSPVGATATAVAPGAFDVLDACHRQAVAMLARLSDLVSGLDQGDPDREAREAAEEIIWFFSQTARQHHEDEERVPTSAARLWATALENELLRTAVEL